MSADFPSGLIPNQLQTEIDEEPLITVAVSYIERIDDLVRIWFPSALSGAEQTELDNVVSVYVPDTTDTLAGIIYQLDTLDTTDDTVTTISTITTETDTVIYVQCNMVAVNDTVNEGSGWLLNQTFINNSGTLTTLGGQDKLTFQNNTWDVNFSISGTDIQVDVQGEIGTNVSWKSTIIYSVNSYSN
jgi:hypothetical protein